MSFFSDSDMDMRKHNSSGNIDGTACTEWQPLLTLLAAGDELAPAEQARIAVHLEHCAACSAALDREEAMLALVEAHRSEPDAAFLASCRAGLDDALDREEEGGWLSRSLGLLLPSSWISPRPAWSGAILLIIGFTVGVLGPRLLLRSTVAPNANQNSVQNSGPAVAVSNGAGTSGLNAGNSVAANINAPSSNTSGNIPLTMLDLHSADVAGINVFPNGIDAGPPHVELHLRGPRPMMVQGTVDDDDVESILLQVLRSGDRFCPDPSLRVDAVNLLRARSNDPEVRAVLCHVIRSDHSPEVRLKALEAINGAEPQDIIRDTLLDALVDDQSAGVRTEAINSLRDMAAKGQVVPNDHMLSVLRDRMKNDRSDYIRSQSAAAIRYLSAHQ